MELKAIIAIGLVVFIISFIMARKFSNVEI